MTKIETKHFDEPIKGALIWGVHNPEPLVVNITGARCHELARVAFWEPILDDKSLAGGPDTPMEEVFVPYRLYRELQDKLR